MTPKTHLVTRFVIPVLFLFFTSQVQASNQKWTKPSVKELKEKLGNHAYRICWENGTERPYSGKYNKIKDDGTFVCSTCEQELFSSSTKYDSKTGWPSFYDAIHQDKITLHEDSTLFMTRTEIRCSRCGAHLGHLFNDGPAPTGKRYCINSVCLEFKKRK